MPSISLIPHGDITYDLKRARSRFLRISVRPSGEIVVTQPPGISDDARDAFIQSKIRWIFRKKAFFEKCISFPIIPEELPALKQRARMRVEERLRVHQKKYGISVRGISIRNQKTRWGSCSRKGNVSFNVRIALLSDRHADYVIVHELCHVKEFNHSQKFWALVSQTIPEYREIRAALRSISLQ